jgi:hypothetical protein
VVSRYIETKMAKETLSFVVSLARNATVRAVSTPVREGRTGDTPLRSTRPSEKVKRRKLADDARQITLNACSI